MRIPFACTNLCSQLSLPTSVHLLAAADIDRLSGHVVPFVGSEEGDQLRDVVRVANATKGDGRCVLQRPLLQALSRNVQYRVKRTAQQRRVDGAGTDAINRDP